MPKERDEWTIHGIWPSQYHKVGPQFCNKSMPFDRDALEPLESELQEKWIDIEYGRTSYSLWEHEWNKHGTCAAVMEELSNEFKYFHEGLNLLSAYDMKNVLAKANILPGNTYELATILNGIDRVLGKRGLVICRKSKVRIYRIIVRRKKLFLCKFNIKMISDHWTIISIRDTYMF